MNPVLMPVVWAGAGFAYAALEFWLGRTDKTKSGSVLELVLSSVHDGLGYMLRKKP